MTRLGTGSRNHSDTLRCPNRNCGNVSTKLELVESALVEGVARWLSDCRVNVSRKPAADTAKAERTASDKVRAEYIKTERNTRGNADRCNFTLNVTPLFPEIKTGAE